MQLTGFDKMIQRMYLEDGLSSKQIADSLNVEEARVILTLDKIPRKSEEKTSVLKSRMMQIQDNIADVFEELLHGAENEGVRAKIAIEAAKFAHGVYDTKQTAPSTSAEEVARLLEQAAKRHLEQLATVIDVQCKPSG